jgi:hypothetical protein
LSEGWKTEHHDCFKEGKERENVVQIETFVVNGKGQI